MDNTSNYKEYTRLVRNMTIEDSFSKGMMYENTPLDLGYSKLLVNYDLRNQGASLVPRGGLRDVYDRQALTLPFSVCVHHTGQAYYEEVGSDDAKLIRYTLLTPTANNRPSYNGSYVVLETSEGSFICKDVQLYDSDKTTPLLGTYYGFFRTPLDQMNSETFSRPSAEGQGVHASLDSNTYLPAVGTASVMFRLYIKYEASSFSVSLVKLAPYEPVSAQAVNTGYNMLKAYPYTFETGLSSSVASLTLDGVIPYANAACTEVKLNANIGETVYYKLIYRVPTTVPEGTAYKVSWRIKNLADGTTTTTIQSVRASSDYTPGDDIILAHTVAYKQCTLIVDVYDADEVDAYEYVSEEDDYRNLRPIKSTTVSCYYTFDDNTKSNANLTMKTYDLVNCAGMCTWQQRLVMWGVVGAHSAVWFSQTNQPDYFPYPNNVEILPEEVLYCVPYLSNLLVFTTTKLYMMSVVSASDGSTYFSTKCVQERLLMTKEDANTILVVKNMVYFKSGSYFYLIVPSMKGTGDLQVAPVSTPIVSFLDKFLESARQVIDDTYDLKNVLNFVTDEDEYTLSIRNYNDHLDGNVIRNIFNMNMLVHRKNYDNYSVQFSLCLNYDTVLRTWTTYVYQTGSNVLVPYINSITDNVVYVTLTDIDMTHKAMSFRRFDKLNPTDPSLDIHHSIFKNYQLLDTGYRNHVSGWKKRFREIQFCVNNLNQDTLTFNTAFLMDDDTRKNFYKYSVSYISDPDDPNYGQLYVEREAYDPAVIHNSLVDADNWLLDFSAFPDITVAKVRFRVSGKGYNGRLKLASKNDIMYEILNVNWVYRKMNAR